MQRVEEKSDNAFHARAETAWKTYLETPSTPGISETWGAFFAAIQRANTVLNRVGQTAFTQAEQTANLKGFLEGQA